MPFDEKAGAEKNINDNSNKSEINYLLKEFVFSDESANFVREEEHSQGRRLIISIRTAKNNAEHVLLNLNGINVEAKLCESRGLFDYFEVDAVVVNGPLNYYFVIHSFGEVYFYNKQGITQRHNGEYDFKYFPGFNTPDWAKGTIFYQIYVDRFFNGDESNDVVNNEYIYLEKPSAKAKSWQAEIGTNDIGTFYGGDIQGIMDKMEYINNLGVEVILLNPVFVSPSSHKYDIQDYDYIDPHYGIIINDNDRALAENELSNQSADKYIIRTTDKENLEKSNELFIKFVELAHSYGIKVVMDGVFNHCGSFNKWLDKEGFYKQAGYSEAGAYFDRESPYHSYFSWNGYEWPDNEEYDCWWGHLNHPKLNYENSSAAYEAVMDIAKKWVSPPYNCDGWRLDVAADLGYSKEFNHKFWQDFRKTVKEANPDAIILAEHYGDPSEWLLGNEWDTVMNYDAFMEPVTYFLTGMEKHSDSFDERLLNNSMIFEESMRYHMAKFSSQSLLVSLNQLSNHDHSRFLTRTNKAAGRLQAIGALSAETGINKSVMYEAVVIQMTWPGAPGIYYGDEAGLCGWADPDNRRPYPWGAEDRLMIRFHKDIIGLRKNYTCLKTGSMEYLYNNYGILSYGRWDEKSRIAVVINNNEDKMVLNLPVWKLECAEEAVFTQIMRTFNGSYEMSGKEYTVLNGKIEIEIGAFSAVILAEKGGLL